MPTFFHMLSYFQTIITTFAVQMACAQGHVAGYDLPRHEVVQEHVEALEQMTTVLDSIGAREVSAINIYREQYPETSALWPILDRLESLFAERERLLYSVTSSSPSIVRLDHSINIGRRDLQQAVAALREAMESQQMKYGLDGPDNKQRNP
jgi:hypothetical protein